MDKSLQKILIVDDNEENLKIVGGVLKSQGYSVILSLNGPSGLEIMRQNKIDLVLLDIMMPKMDGYEVCREIKNDPSLDDIPVIFLSAFCDDIARGFHLGGVDYVTKPFKHEELIARVESHLHLKFLKDELKEKNKNLTKALEISDELLLNVLPKRVAEDFKTKGFCEPKVFENVTLLVSDFINFTAMSAQIDPTILFSELNDMFSAFDRILIDNQCDRIKTIGDAYFAVCGMPDENENHAANIINAAKEILSYIRKRNRKSDIKWKLRIGVHSGKIVGGIVGINKYIYDVFGADVNTVFRMESSSKSMKINVSEATWNIVKNRYAFEKRLPKNIKGLGLMNMYFVK